MFLFEILVILERADGLPHAAGENYVTLKLGRVRTASHSAPLMAHHRLARDGGGRFGRATSEGDKQTNQENERSRPQGDHPEDRVPVSQP